MRVVGLDLSGSEKKPSGWALMEARGFVASRLLYSDSEIIEATLTARPVLVAIDAPLTLPKSGLSRYVDRKMHKLGYPVLPPLCNSMIGLTYRGIKIAKEIERSEINVIEVHPSSARKAMKIPTKNKEEIIRIFREMGLEISSSITFHEIDAITSCIVSILYLRGECEVVGDDEGKIIMPKRVDWRCIELGRQ